MATVVATIKPDPSLEDVNYQNGSGSEATSPLAQFGYFKNLSEKKTTRDGQPPKRRGPKPDSKPALTRRQELNRQAQRTHRERKEMYIKALEQEVLRLKETFSTTSRERDAFAEENRRLKKLLMAHGISFDLSSPTMSGLPSAYGSSMSSASGYGSGSASTGYTSPPSLQHSTSSMSNDGMYVQQMPLQQQAQHTGQHGMDYDQIGIDFVLTYDRSPYLSPPPQQ